MKYCLVWILKVCIKWSMSGNVSLLQKVTLQKVTVLLIEVFMILMGKRLFLLCAIVFLTLACQQNTAKRILVTYPVLSGIVYSDESLELETVK